MTDERHEFQVVRSAADIPHFASEEEERQFWQTHEMGEEMFRNPELPPGLARLRGGTVTPVPVPAPPRSRRPAAVRHPPQTRS